LPGKHEPRARDDREVDHHARRPQVQAVFPPLVISRQRQLSFEGNVQVVVRDTTFRYFSPKDADNWLKLCHTIDRAVKIGLPIMKANPVRPEFKMLMKSLGGAIGTDNSLL
jgi:hypothetical protein